MTNFGSTKADLSLKYRIGLEYALAKADFLTVPDIVLVQAFAIFLFLVRRHDNPRFVWMMTGLAIRMAQALGLHRDGSHFEHLTPYEVEMRRRVWWALCVLDVRASEDQGTDLSITSGSFDTKLPLNINDADIDPQTKQTPPPRQAMTDMAVSLVSLEICDIVRRWMAQAAKGGASGPEDQSCPVSEFYETLDRLYLQYSTESGNIMRWVAVNTTRLLMAKMTLIFYLPVLFSSPSEHFSGEIRAKLLVSAIEVAEYNHVLNSERACRHLRWIFQTYTHWYAIVYLLLEIARRPWSPVVERAWVALHSSWLIPVQSNLDKSSPIWFPLRKMMAKARKHRDAELERLRGDAPAAAQLEVEDRMIPLPASSGPFPSGNGVDLFRERWRKLVAMPTGAGPETRARGMPASGASAPSTARHAADATQHKFGSVPVYGERELWPNSNFEPAYLAGQELSNTNETQNSAMVTSPYGEGSLGPADEAAYKAPPAVPLAWSGGLPTGSSIMPWLWADADPPVEIFANVDVDMDLEGEIDWYNWVESAKVMEWNSGSGGDGPR